MNLFHFSLPINFSSEYKKVNPFSYGIVEKQSSGSTFLRFVTSLVNSCSAPNWLTASANAFQPIMAEKSRNFSPCTYACMRRSRYVVQPSFSQKCCQSEFVTRFPDQE